MEEKRTPDIPDFAQLNDRLIAPLSPGPFLAIRTNLDKPPTEAERNHEDGR